MPVRPIPHSSEYELRRWHAALDLPTEYDLLVEIRDLLNHLVSALTPAASRDASRAVTKG